MFKNVFIERKVQHHPRTQKILKALTKVPQSYIDSIDDYFGKYQKHYLQKRNNLSLFVGSKTGTLVKKAPPAYGGGDNHYYFIHTYNCPLECEYCYLQGHFHSPDIVAYINHEDVGKQISKLANNDPNTPIFFHAGEFSDSLVLSHYLDDWAYYWKLFAKLPNANLELRTKSSNIGSIAKLPPQNNCIISFSLAPEDAIKSFDHKTSPMMKRLEAIEKLHLLGHPVGIHLDPIIYHPRVRESYHFLIKKLSQAIPLEKVRYFSLGVVRFPESSIKDIKKNYPSSKLFQYEMIKSTNNKVQYSIPLKNWILRSIRQELVAHSARHSTIYYCMEEKDEN